MSAAAEASSSPFFHFFFADQKLVSKAVSCSKYIMHLNNKKYLVMDLVCTCKPSGMEKWVYGIVFVQSLWRRCSVITHILVTFLSHGFFSLVALIVWRLFKPDFRNCKKPSVICVNIKLCTLCIDYVYVEESGYLQLFV